MIWIAVDAMGGDDAPRHIVDGALAAVRHFDLGVVLVGRAEQIEAELAGHTRPAPSERLEFTRDSKGKVRIVDTPDVVGMEESPAAALRRKPAASIKVAAD